MTWAEKIIDLKPIIVTGGYLLIVMLSFLLLEAVPIWSFFAWPAFGLAAFTGFTPIIVWTSALHAVVHSRLNNDPTRKQKERAPFRSFVLWVVVWCVLASIAPLLPPTLLWATPVVTLALWYFYLKSVWVTTAALHALETSENAFRTFIQVLFFPIGVWFLQPRLQRLLAVSPQTNPSPA